MKQTMDGWFHMDVQTSVHDPDSNDDMYPRAFYGMCA